MGEAEWPQLAGAACVFAFALPRENCCNNIQRRLVRVPSMPKAAGKKRQFPAPGGGHWKIVKRIKELVDAIPSFFHFSAILG